VTRKSVRLLIRNQLLRYEDQMRDARLMRLDKFDIDIDDAAAILAGASLYFCASRNRIGITDVDH
jgi:hypothetical protein